MQTEATMGRPPLPDSEKRTVRKVLTFTPDEWTEIEAYFQHHGGGFNKLGRDKVLDHVRANAADRSE